MTEILNLFSTAKYWNSFLFTMMISMSFQYLAVLFFTTMFETRKRSIKPLVAFLITKGFAGGILGVINSYVTGPVEFQFFTLCFNVFSSILVFVFLFYTFEDGLIKIIFGAIGVELMGELVVLPGSILVNVIAGRDDIYTNFTSVFEMTDMLYLVYIALFVVLIYPHVKPILKQYRTYEIKHKKIAACISIGYVLAVQVCMIDPSAETDISYIMNYVMPVVFSLFVGVFLLFYYKSYRMQIRTKQKNQELQYKLLESYYGEIAEQVQHVEKSHDLIVRQMKEMASLPEMMAYGMNHKQDSDNSLESYLGQMKQELDQIKAGIYSKNPLLDSIFYFETEEARKQSVKLQYQFGNFDWNVADVNLFAKLINSILGTGIKDWSRAAKEEKREMYLAIGNVKTQTVIKTALRSKSAAKQIKKNVEKYLKGHSVSVMSEKKDAEIVLSVLLKL